tara:strand:+ start:266 stop:562 length:297 start_codon:yes stop_codon:yes gene_type:complete
LKIIFLSLLTLVLVSCGEIRLEIGGVGEFDEVQEVGTYTWIPEPDLNDINQNGYLVDTRTGEVEWCLKADGIYMSCGIIVESVWKRRRDEAIAEMGYP